MSSSRELSSGWAAAQRPEARGSEAAEGRRPAKDVVLLVDYPLFVDGHATELGFWGLPKDVLRRLTRLNELYDRQINWDYPNDPTWRISERDRNEFNALLPFVATELQLALGDRWRIVVESQPI